MTTTVQRRTKRKGGLSIIQIALIAAAVGIILIVAAAVAYFTDQASKRSPLEIPPYPSAAYWGTSDVQTTSRNVFYRSTDSPEVIEAYYQQKMVEHYGNNDQSCVRFPATGNVPGSDTNPNTVPYKFTCLFDNSGFNTSQYTQVDIYPGEPSTDPFFDAKGKTIVEYEEQWQR